MEDQAYYYCLLGSYPAICKINILRHDAEIASHPKDMSLRYGLSEVTLILLFSYKLERILNQHFAVRQQHTK